MSDAAVAVDQGPKRGFDWFPYVVALLSGIILVVFLAYPIGKTTLYSFIKLDDELTLGNLTLANLDAKLRVEMREEIRRIQKELGIMSIYVTHDQEEAMSVSDRLAVFNLGQLMQAGQPEEVYADPTSLFVADFIGKANFFPAHVANRDGAGAKVSLGGGHELALTRLNPVPKSEVGEIADDFDATVMVRPEHVEIGPPGNGGLACRVRRIQFLGSFIRYIGECADATREVIVDSPRAVPGIGEGSEASLTIHPADAKLFHKGDAA